MIIVPELETVVLLVPRTGSRSLRRAVEAKYPQAMTVYRHMEADGVPVGYDRWPRVGVVRNPVERLWSLYKFLGRFAGDYDPRYITAQRSSVDRPFADWIVKNQVVFTSPYQTGGSGFFPWFTVLHALPENLKSQWLTLRPDLGTEVYRFDELSAVEQRLGVRLERSHQTPPQDCPDLDEAATAHIAAHFGWDLEATS